MNNLDYKGWKSTRLRLVIACIIMATIAVWFGKVTGAEWLSFLQWAIGLYSLSEVGAKGAAAIQK